MRGSAEADRQAGRVTQSPLGHRKGSGFYSESTVEPLEDFKQRKK